MLFDEEVAELAAMCRAEQQMHGLALQRGETALDASTPSDEDLLVALQGAASDLGVTSLSEVLLQVLDRQQINYALFCCVNALNDDITRAKEAAQVAGHDHNQVSLSTLWPNLVSVCQNCMSQYGMYKVGVPTSVARIMTRYACLPQAAVGSHSIGSTPA